MTDNNTRDELKQLYQQGNITFFLGAGISMNNGLPSWKDLVTAMYFKYMAAESWGRLRPFSNYLYIASRHYMDKMNESSDIIIRKLKTGWTEQEYSSSLWDSLYSTRQTVPDYNISFLPACIADVIKKDPQKIKSVITYNFDDILEEAFGYKSFTGYCIVYDQTTQQQPGTVPVFHVHGYVPFNNNPEKKIYGRLVFSEDDYNSLFNDPAHWANLVQLSSLSASVNIMIGLSLNDRNLRRILDITSKQPIYTRTYIFLKKPRPVVFTPAEIEIIDKEARELMNTWQGGGGIKAENRKNEQIADIINGVFKNDAESNNNVLKALKVTPVWVDDYNEIAGYLQDLIR